MVYVIVRQCLKSCGTRASRFSMKWSNGCPIAPPCPDRHLCQASWKVSFIVLPFFHSFILSFSSFFPFFFLFFLFSSFVSFSFFLTFLPLLLFFHFLFPPFFLSFFPSFLFLFFPFLLLSSFFMFPCMDDFGVLSPSEFLVSHKNGTRWLGPPTPPGSLTKISYWGRPGGALKNP